MCLVFCSYGCYSSGRPAVWAPGSLPGLVAVGSSEIGPGFRTVDWAGLLASSHPSPAGSESPCLLPPDRARGGGCDTFSQLPQRHSEATVLTENSCTEGAVHQPLPRAKALRPSSTARAAPAGVPGYAGELSDTEALSSPSLAPERSHQQVLHIQVQGHNG